MSPYSVLLMLAMARQCLVTDGGWDGMCGRGGREGGRGVRHFGLKQKRITLILSTRANDSEIPRSSPG